MQVTGNNQIHYNLSIRVTATDGFSFFVTEAMSGDLMHREDFAKREDELLHRTLAKAMVRPTIQRHDYDSIKVVIDSDSTCIPLEDFNRESLDELYEAVFHDVDLLDNEVCYTILPQLEVVEAFTVPRLIRETVSELYPEAVFTNSYAVVMERVANYCKQRPLATRPLFVYAQSNQLFVFCVFQDRLLFANSFSIDKDQNALYFLLSVWKELGLDVRENTCFISGDPEPVKQLATEARNYLLHVEELEAVDLVHL